MGGRGAGKTRAGAEWIRAEVEGRTPLGAGRRSRVGLVGPALADVREVMIEGPSGLRAIAPNGFRPTFESSRRRLVWPNGAVAYAFSAEDPDALRGPQFDCAWCDANVDFVGVDWYAPLSDWRDGAYHLDAGLGASDHRLDYLRSNVEGGEGFDWYYADPNDRLAQARTPITDGSAGKPWVFRYKDLRSWWSNLHYDRPGGSEDASPTSWVPESKPIWFVETGVPAVDKGANQPNVFHDPKSSESAVPHFSSGARDDLIQRRALEALLSYWEPSEGLNPTSSIYAGPMIASDRTHIWTWDSRPFPDFPARDEIWRDGPNWRLGHWLTGRIGLAPLALVVDEIASAAGDGLADASALEGLVAGYVIERPMAIRGALEPLARAYRFDAAERGGRVAFLPLSGPAVGELKLDDVAIGDGAVRIERIRADASEQPIDARIRFLDDTRDFRPGAASARGLDAALRPVVELAAPLVLDHATAERIARSWLVDAAAHAERVRLDAPPSALAIEPGDIVALDDGAGSADYFVARIDDRVSRALVLTRSADGPSGVFSGPDAGVSTPPTSAPAKPYGVVLDLPLLPTESERGGPLVAAAAAPWPGDVSARAGDAGAERARLRRRAGIGELQWDLYAGPVGRWDEGNVTRVRLHHGALSSATNEQVYAGANALAIEGGSGEWEVLQFRDAVLVSPGVFELRGLLRGLAGSEAGMGAPTSAGARVVVLDAAIAPAPLEPFERGGQLAWRFVAAGGDPFGSQAHLITAADARIDDRPLAPVHLRVGREPGGVRFSWIRRTRFEGDDWSAADAPLGEADERYLFELYKDGSPALTREPSGAETLVTLAEEAAIFAGAPLYAFDIAVSQISATFGPGSARRAMVYA